MQNSVYYPSEVAVDDDEAKRGVRGVIGANFGWHAKAEGLNKAFLRRFCQKEVVVPFHFRTGSKMNNFMPPSNDSGYHEEIGM